MAPRMHQNMQLETQRFKNYLGRGIAPSLGPTPCLLNTKDGASITVVFGELAPALENGDAETLPSKFPTLSPHYGQNTVIRSPSSAFQ